MGNGGEVGFWETTKEQWCCTTTTTTATTAAHFDSEKGAMGAVSESKDDERSKQSLLGRL